MQKDLHNVVQAACAVMFAEGFAATIAFPFASFMVDDLRGTGDNLGMMTGLYFTVFSVGPLLTARKWAAAANSMGRRPCLLISLCAGAIFNIVLAFCPSFQLVLVLRFAQGLMTCSLPMARTGLREMLERVEGDEVRSFAYLQTAFAASCITGPALGGFLYGRLAGQGIFLPWTIPYATCSFLYVIAILVAYAYTVETINLECPVEVIDEQRQKVSLLSDVSIGNLLIMITGHSFVFTGWEIGYPLLARTRADWTSAMIGSTFLAGSLGLFIHTLLTYPTMVKKMGLGSIWTLSWVISITVLLAFPRVLSSLIEIGFDHDSPAIFAANYVAQLFISILQGANFTTLQLMVNYIVSFRSDKGYALPVANGWMMSVQSLARGASPLIIGSSVQGSSVLNGCPAFDWMALVAMIGCLFVGIDFSRRLASLEMDNASWAFERQASDDLQHLDSTNSPKLLSCVRSYNQAPSPFFSRKFVTKRGTTPETDGAYVALDSDGKSQPSTLKGYVLTVGLAAFGAGITLVTGIASKSVSFPRYTENFVRCLTASITMLILCFVNRDKIFRDSATMTRACWLAMADWFFLWGYVESMAYFDTTQYAASSSSVSPMLSVALGYLLLSEPADFLKLVGLVRNVAVVVLVIDPLGFFGDEGHAKAAAHEDPTAPIPVSGSENKLVLGFFWCSVACLGTVFMRVIQRSIANVPSSVTSFWCFALNTILWFPPGSSPPKLRVPILWPPTPQDAQSLDFVPPVVWMCAILSGCMGAVMIAGQAVALSHIDVGTYSNLVSPLNLVFSFLVDLVSQDTVPKLRVLIGVTLAVAGIVGESALAKQNK